MLKLLTGLSLCCALGGAAFAQAPAHPKGEHHAPKPAHQATTPDTTQLPPDLKYEGSPASGDPSAFPGEVSNQGYPGGVPENPR